MRILRADSGGSQVCPVAPCGTGEKGSEADKVCRPVLHTLAGADWEPAQENAAHLSLVSDGSPISLRSKRKGRVFPDDMRIVKRVRLSLE